MTKMQDDVVSLAMFWVDREIFIHPPVCREANDIHIEVRNVISEALWDSCGIELYEIYASALLSEAML